MEFTWNWIVERILLYFEFPAPHKGNKFEKPSQSVCKFFMAFEGNGTASDSPFHLVKIENKMFHFFV